MENIERLLQKLQGGGESGEQYEEVVYEGYAPGGVAVLVYALTDNRNRTAGEVRHVFGKYGGSLGTSGSVAWQFERKGVLVCENTERPRRRPLSWGLGTSRRRGKASPSTPTPPRPTASPRPSRPGASGWRPWRWSSTPKTWWP